MNLNMQPVSKLVSGSKLSVFKIFKTIQGEGPYAGRPAVFIRLGGCNLQCPFCDTDYTSSTVIMTPKDIVATAILYARGDYPLVVITGGEPFRQDMSTLVEMLHARGFLIQIETNGTLHREGFPYAKVTVVCSPKTGSVNPGIRKHIHAVKYVLHADAVSQVDGLPILALGHPAKPQLARLDLPCDRIYVQPMDEGDTAANARHLEAAVNSCLRHGYTLCLQVHKILNLE
jgi:7-carboxy-7-deazaguanine synthase